ncbi:Susd and RagB outer membrane lipoprotein [Bacteroidales bacterium Barb4]|nr:Susd and RagB outer membrane lipoprotein [Bacteroidales bacterium Barb4]
MKRILSYMIVLSGLLFASCSDWLDINKDPNNALKSDVSKDLLLSYVENTMNRAQTSSSDIHFMAQHLSKSGDYSGAYPFLTGLIQAQQSDTYWDTPYQLIANLRTIRAKAIEDNDPGYEAIAIALTVQNFQKLVDIFNNVPYTEAALGVESTSPTYDKGDYIYDRLIEECETAAAKIDEALALPGYSTTKLAASDITCHGNLQQWKRYIYTIELGLLMRISNIRDVSAQVTAIKDKVLNIEENINANPGYYKETDKMNPTYQSFGFTSVNAVASGHQQVRPTAFLVDFLKYNNDPRLRVYIEPRKQLGEDLKNNSNYTKYGLENDYYIGVPYGQMSPPDCNHSAGIGMGILGGSSSFTTGPQNPLTVKSGAEAGFFLAEAALRGLIPGGDDEAKRYYEAAVVSAISRYEKAIQDDGYAATLKTLNFPEEAFAPAITVSGEQAAKDYLAQGNSAVNWDLMTTTEQKLEAIHTQKWITLYFVSPYEAWSEQRRSDYPRLTRSASIANGNKLIARFHYPDKERILNGDRVKAEGEIDIYESLVFWDKKNDYAPETPVYE